MKVSNFDYVYAVLEIIIGIIMISSPRTFMGKAKYDEASLKTESLVKKSGIGLIILAIIFAIYIYYKQNA